MTLPLFPATLAAWRAAHGMQPDQAPREVAPGSVVKLSIKAKDGARTADTLGADREGTGVVIDAAGLILTIGYLVLEAGSILVIGPDGQVVPAHVAGFDHVTGFGLVRVSRPMQTTAIEFGDSARLVEFNRVHVCAHGQAGGSTFAYCMGRRRFTGYWEYMIDGAIFTAPARFEHSGAALLDEDGRLLGIGSLWVGDVLDAGVAFPGNMFVPIDLLKPLLDDLVAHGRRSGAGRPWLGVYTEEVKGHVVVTRVLPESPAAQAGIEDGDVILGVAGQAIGDQSDFYDKLWSAGPAGIEVALNILHGREIRAKRVHSIDRVAWLTAGRTA